MVSSLHWPTRHATLWPKRSSLPSPLTRYYIPSWLLFCSNQTKWTTFYPNRCHIYLARRYFIACTTECIGTNLQEKFKQQYLIPKNLISKTQAFSYTAFGCLLSRAAVMCFTHTMCETQCFFYISLLNQFLNYQNSFCLTVIQNKTKYSMVLFVFLNFYSYCIFDLSEVFQWQLYTGDQTHM